jgi:hypothetical protein
MPVAKGYAACMGDDSTTGPACCPACGGAGGGPFGRPGSAWDVEAYVCPRCEGLGAIPRTVPVARPLAKGRGEPMGAHVQSPGVADCEDQAHVKTLVGRS